MPRIDKTNYYLDIAQTVSERSTCLRRHYGAIIVQNDEIVSTGYNGAPRGRKNCIDLGYCTREAMNIPSGERYELCRSVHAEANAIISASRREVLGATLYMVCVNPKTRELIAGSTSCSMCRRLIINAGDLPAGHPGCAHGIPHRGRGEGVDRGGRLSAQPFERGAGERLWVLRWLRVLRLTATLWAVFRGDP